MLPDHVAVRLIETLEHAGKQLAFELNYIFRPVDEAELNIERIILGQVAARGVRLRAIDMRGLIHTFQPGNAVFLIELRALREIGNAVKVFNFEKIAAAFSSTRDDLR